MDTAFDCSIHLLLLQACRLKLSQMFELHKSGIDSAGTRQKKPAASSFDKPHEGCPKVHVHVDGVAI